MQNWAGNYAFEAKALQRPGSIAELQRLVAGVERVRAIGARHSFNGIADTPGELLHLGDIDPDIVIDRERMIVTVGAGSSYAVLAAALPTVKFRRFNYQQFS